MLVAKIGGRERGVWNGATGGEWVGSVFDRGETEGRDQFWDRFTPKAGAQRKITAGGGGEAARSEAPAEYGLGNPTSAACAVDLQRIAKKVEPSD